MCKAIFTSYNIYAIGPIKLIVFLLREIVAFCNLNFGKIHKYIAMTLSAPVTLLFFNPFTTFTNSSSQNKSSFTSKISQTFHIPLYLFLQLYLGLAHSQDVLPISLLILVLLAKTVGALKILKLEQPRLRVCVFFFFFPA